MNNRIEYKIDIENSQKINFLNYLEKFNYKKLHEPRIINSIYFENLSNEIYNDSIEGLSPRKKIRIRYYGDPKNINDSISFNLETKFTNNLGRSKDSKHITGISYYLKHGIFDEKYGICYPKTLVSYKRSYFIAEQFRITIDENINFSLYDKFLYKKNTIFSNEIVVEIKNNDISEVDNLRKMFPFKEIRFSKYCKSLEMLDLVN